jgi:hypothetical protein
LAGGSFPRFEDPAVLDDLSGLRPAQHSTLTPMREPCPATTAAEHLRIARLLEAHGDAIGAVLAYREVICAGIEPAATEARRCVALLARRAAPAPAP